MEQLNRKISQRSEEIFESLQERFCRKTNQLFALLFVLEWISAVFVAYVVSPMAWSGVQSSIHPHVFAAVFLGGAVSLFPIFLTLSHAERRLTCYVVGVAQTLWSIIFIHLTEGRIETHFHIFGSLAFLAFYRNWKVFILPTLILAVDHYFRGVYWPQSVFGISNPEPWRWFEHLSWIVFEDCFLIVSCLTSVKEMHAISDRTAQLEFTNDAVEAKVIKRTRELEISREELKEANKTKDTFLANMSHEIRTPLNGIIGMSSLLNETPLSEKQTRYVNVIVQSGKILLNVISDILEFSKIQVGKLHLHESAFELEELISEAVGIMAYAASEKKLKLTFKVDQALPRKLIGDAFRIKQMIINLLNNAIKFTDKGEVCVSVESEEKNQYDDKNCELKITVSDTGIGIAKNHIDHLFKPFTQIDSSNTRKYGGTGLGLSIVSHIVALMNGTIEVKSSLGVGSEFILKVMLQKANADAVIKKQEDDSPVEKIIEATTLSPCKILIVEDNLSNQFVIEEFLKTLGYTFSMASNGLEALEKLEKEPIDICLMDIQMPVMDGIEATRRIRASRHKNLPIIALSASVFDVHKSACFEAGIDDFLEKPVRMDKLKNILEKWIARKSSGVSQ